MPGLTNVVPTLTSSIANFQNAGGFGSDTDIKTVTFNNTAGTVNLFTVTGDVIVRVACAVGTDCESAGACNAEVGIAADPDVIIATTDITLMEAREIWHDATPDAEIEALTVLKDFIITDGNDIILTLSAQADSGVLVFYCIWTPLSAGATVVAA